MSFWTSPDFYPNLASRFLVQVGMVEGGAQFLARSVSPLPGYSSQLIGGDMNQDGTGYDPYNKQARIKWDPVTISFVNDANSNPGESALFKFFQLLYDSGYNPPAPSEAGEVTSADIPSILVSNVSVSQNLINVMIDMLHPSGYSTARFELVDPVITSVKAAGLNYDTDNIHNFDVTFQYSHIKYESFSCTTT